MLKKKRRKKERIELRKVREERKEEK